ncbi:MAG: HAMP domain-containing sensor histidine kinase, partial [Chloroflexi bacterium]|nr:HAMP domain-containing sensor histidine kinase [Chloroflexota bacterium]
ENGQINFTASVPQSSSIADELDERGLTIRILDSAGRIRKAFGHYRALPIPMQSLAVIQTHHPLFTTLPELQAHEPLRIYTAPIVEDKHFVGLVQVVHNLGSVRKTLQRLLEALLIGIPLIAIAGSFASYFLVARALAPIDQMTRTARRIVGTEDLAVGTHLTLQVTDDEVGRLAITLDEMLMRLEHSFQRERQFATDASHELRTPVTAMQAILSVIRAERRTLEDYEQALADIAEEAERLSHLVEDLLSLARSDTHQVSPHQSIDLATLLLDVTDALRPLAEAKGLALICVMPVSLPFMGDTDTLIRLFINLVENAVKYTESGNVSITAQTNPDLLLVKISDTGSGIPSADLSHIFNRFYRVEMARSTPGTGLGLAIAQDIARAHSGSIKVESTVGRGTTFTVCLPVSS